MSVAANKQTIERMFAAQLANDIDAYSQILADDLTWEIMQFGIDRPRSKPEMIEMLQAVHRGLSGRWEKRALSMVGEGDSVAVEAEATMELANGNLFRQRYHYVYRFRDGQVRFVREYIDSLASTKAFAGMASPASANE